MTIYEELQARGAHRPRVTDEEEIKELINNGKPHFTLVLTPQPIPCMWATLWR